MHVAMAEVRRNSTDDCFNSYRYSELRVSLEAVLDCRSIRQLNLSLLDLLDDVDLETPQALAARLRPASEIRLVRSVDPRLDERR